MFEFAFAVGVLSMAALLHIVASAVASGIVCEDVLQDGGKDD